MHVLDVLSVHKTYFRATMKQDCLNCTTLCMNLFFSLISFSDHRSNNIIIISHTLEIINNIKPHPLPERTT